MNYLLFDDNRIDLLPFTYTRPVAEIRCGMYTIKEKWEKALDASLSWITESYLEEKYPAVFATDNCYINGTVLPDEKITAAIHNLQDGELLYHQKDEKIIAFRKAQNLKIDELEQHAFAQVNYEENFLSINHVWDIFSLNDQALRADFKVATKGMQSAELPAGNQLIGEAIYIAPSAKINAAVLNASTGPIYIDEGAEIMEGTVIRGPFYLGKGATVKMAAKIYGATTIGPYCKVGGEISNSVIFGYSNKGHDGFLGNSVLGEWCNLGADTNVSNLKNNYANIKIWNYNKQGFLDTGLQFCGLMMGDHSKAGINTMFNTATLVGVSANVFGGGFPRNFIPSFAWGGSDKWMEFRTNKAFEVAERMMERRGVEFDAVEKAILTKVFEETKVYRNF